MFFTLKLALSQRHSFFTTVRPHIRSCTYISSSFLSQWHGVVNHVRTTTPSSPSTIEDLWRERSIKAKQELAERPPADAYSGRSVKVMNGNVADAYQKLNSILSRNKVRAQLRRAERHEKKGEKRRRLSSERWRRQFAHEVRKKVQLVTKIRNRGA